MSADGRWVVDASVVLARLLREERPEWVDDYIDGLRMGRAEFLAPSLLWLEIGNRLVRARSIGDEFALEAMLGVEWLGIQEIPVDRPIRLRALTLARADDLSMHDATYLAVAEATATPLITLDSRLDRAAAKLGLGRRDAPGRVPEPSAPYGRVSADATSLAAIGQAIAEMRREYSS